MNHIPEQLIIWVVGVVFGAGGAWAMVRQTRKDVNAIGAIMRRDRWNLLIALMVTLEKREDRQRLADLMRQQ